MSAVLLRGARLAGADRPVDLLIADGRLDRIAPTAADLASYADLEIVDLDGRFVGPGLWDAHVHMGQWALATSRLDLTAMPSAAATVAHVAERGRIAPPPAGTILVGTGFRELLWPDAPDPDALDRVEVPVALISHDVHTLWTNGAARALLGAPDANGLLREQPAFDLTARLDAVGPHRLDALVAAAASRAAARGVVGITDFEFDDAPSAWRRRFSAGFRGLRVRAAVYPDALDAARDAGIRTNAPLPEGAGLLVGGPLKLFTDGSLNSRTAWCAHPYPGMTGDDASGVPTYTSDEILARAAAGRRLGLVPAIHAIGDRAVTLALDTFAALDAAGDLPATGDRGSVEHVQLARLDDLVRFRALGVRASIQPQHAMDDRDIAEEHWAGRTDRAFAYRALSEAGASIALGSDAPVAPLDPWVAISAAVNRTDDGRPAWHPEQALAVAVALRASQGGIPRLAAGGPADLVVTDADPTDPGNTTTIAGMPVHATMVAGEWSYRS